MPLLVRIALVLIAAFAIAVLVSWQRDEDRCTDTISALFFDLRDERPGAELDAGVQRTIDDCHGGLRLIGPAAVLFEQGDSPRAETVIREAIRREPDSFSAWSALAAIVRESDPAESRRAAARASELNPRHRPDS